MICKSRLCFYKNVYLLCTGEILLKRVFFFFTKTFICYVQMKFYLMMDSRVSFFWYMLCTDFCHVVGFYTGFLVIPSYLKLQTEFLYSSSLSGTLKFQNKCTSNVFLIFITYIYIKHLHQTLIKFVC